MPSIEGLDESSTQLVSVCINRVFCSCMYCGAFSVVIYLKYFTLFVEYFTVFCITMFSMAKV